MIECSILDEQTTILPNKMSDENNSELILVPTPAIGHLMSAGEFAKRLLAHTTRFSTITILLVKPRMSNLVPQINDFISSLIALEPRINCINVPPAPPLPSDIVSKSIENFHTLYMEAHIPHVRQILQDKSPAGIVLDFFCESFVDIANDLQIPSYFYLTSGATFLSLMLYLPTRKESTAPTPSDPDIAIPGFSNLVPSRVLPTAVFDTEGGFTAYLKIAKRFRGCKGIIVNTITELESYALSSLAKDKTVPPIYPIGPVISLKGHVHVQNKVGDEAIFKWLDQQPGKSVVFLCFGSAGEFRAPQIKEIATGLERSGQRFLWSVRQPDGNTDILPEGFVERTRETGLVCGWVPQVEILAHEAIGGFVSHCGWNSILESIWNGVPTVTWPLYAEQQTNAFTMVKELGIAVELRLDYRKQGDEVVPSEEVESAVKEVMKRESVVRKRVEKLKEQSRAALLEGGSSYNMIGQLVKEMVGSHI